MQNTVQSIARAFDILELLPREPKGLALTKIGTLLDLNREEFLIDALVDYQVEPDDPARDVPNPAWRKVDREVKLARVALGKLEKSFGIAAVDNNEDRRKTMRGFKIAYGKLGKQIRAARNRVDKLQTKRSALQKRQEEKVAAGRAA